MKLAPTLLALSLLPSVAPAARAQCSGWLSGPGVNGVNGRILDAARWDPDGPGPEAERLVVCGSFTVAGTALSANVAAWNGQTWEHLGDGLPVINNSNQVTVSAVAVYNGELFVAGTTPAVGTGFVARWTGTQWQRLASVVGSSQVSAGAYDLTVYNGELIVAGQFFSVGGVQARHLARWNGQTWAPFGAGPSQSVGTLGVHDGRLYAAGAFTSVDGVTATGIAAWDGVAWSPLGSGLPTSSVGALVSYGGDLVAAGSFLSAGGTPVRRIARWDGAAWHALGAGLGLPQSQSTEFIADLTIMGDSLIACGRFTPAPDAPADDVARWTGSEWEPLGGGVSGGTSSSCASVIAFGDEVIIGGEFLAAGGTPAQSAARWDGSAWRSMGDGLIGVDSSGPDVSALLSLGNNLIVGGTFTSADGLPAGLVARWNGDRFYPLGTGMAGSPTTQQARINALTLYNGDIVAGGTFLTADGATVNHIARWDGAAWHPLGTGLVFTHASPPTVRGLGVSDGALLVGGLIDSAGGVASRGIARWTGSAWQAFAQPISGGVPEVRALVELNGDLIAAGAFTSIGGVAANRVARWDGAAWHPLGAGLSGFVHDAAVLDGQLYVCGSFAQAGGAPAPGVARWDGAAWHPLGTGTTTIPWAITAYNGTIVLGGYFSEVGGVPASRIARWTGSAWQPLGAGLAGGSVSSLTVHNGELIAGGSFTSAGGNVSAYLARWTDSGAPWTAADPQSTDVAAGSAATFAVTLADGYRITGVQWRHDGQPLADGPTPHGSTISGAQSTTLVISATQPGDTGEYEVTVATPCGMIVRTATLAVTPNPCPADWDRNGSVNSGDISSFLTVWIASVQAPDLVADFNNDGVVNSGDISAFLTAWIDAVANGC